jgi:hypothetical protein
MLPLVTLPEEIWKPRQSLHEERTRPWVAGRLHRREFGLKHPVEDFLFDYYPFRASHLQRWGPGYGVVLEGDGAEIFLGQTGYEAHPGGGVWLNPASFPANRRDGLVWAKRILAATGERAPQFGCFGLHEWAMVYRSTEVRHTAVPLRMKPNELAAFLETERVACSHYDAFRFFTPSARSLNLLQPEKGRQPEFEQPACLHANMDLYKWSYKFAPWLPAEYIADAFELARDIREVDMRASPYDLAEQGYPAIKIETPEGKREYERYQRQFMERARPLRQRLLDYLSGLL